MQATGFLDNLVGPIVYLLSATKHKRLHRRKARLSSFAIVSPCSVSSSIVSSIKSSPFPFHLALLLPLHHNHHHQQQSTDHLPIFTSKPSSSYLSSHTFTKHPNISFQNPSCLPTKFLVPLDRSQNHLQSLQSSWTIATMYNPPPLQLQPRK
jgi:hypothetical protein